MADASCQDDIMPLARTKHFLALAEANTLPCSFALTKDRKEVLLLIDKSGRPRKVADELKGSGRAVVEPASQRWGEVRIDLNDEPRLVRFTVNRAEPAGSAHLLEKLVKRAGYEGVVINLDETQDQASEPSAPPAPPPAPPAAPQFSVADLKAHLVGLVQHTAQVIAEHPQHKADLLHLVHESQDLLAGGDLSAAAARIHDLEVALATTETAPHDGLWEAPRATDGAAVAFAKSSLLWRGCRTQMRTKLDGLKAAMIDAYSDEPEIQDAIRQNRDTLDRAFDGLDDRLDTALDAAVNDHDPERLARHAGEIRAIIASYISHVAGNERLKALEANPFGVQLGLTATITNVLTALVGLSKQMH